MGHISADIMYYPVKVMRKAYEAFMESDTNMGTGYYPGTADSYQLNQQTTGKSLKEDNLWENYSLIIKT